MQAKLINIITIFWGGLAGASFLSLRMFHQLLFVFNLNQTWNCLATDEQWLRVDPWANATLAFNLSA